MDLQLQNKRALITGSTAGIGFATARQLAKEGAEVIVNGRSKARVDEAVALLKNEVPGANISGIVADFSKVSEVNALIQQLPAVDILINNLSVFEPKAFTEIPDEDWFRFYEINIMSGVRLARHYLPGMLEQNWGRIIFISSESAIVTPEEMIHYGMTKTAQLAISRGLSELTRGTRVTVNSVLPGPTRSEGVDAFVANLAHEKKITVEQMEEEFFKTARPTSLLQRFITVEEIANFVTYVASPLASAMNGSALRSDGGVAKTVF